MSPASADSAAPERSPQPQTTTAKPCGVLGIASTSNANAARAKLLSTQPGFVPRRSQSLAPSSAPAAIASDLAVPDGDRWLDAASTPPLAARPTAAAQSSSTPTSIQRCREPTVSISGAQRNIKIAGRNAAVTSTHTELRGIPARDRASDTAIMTYPRTMAGARPKGRNSQARLGESGSDVASSTKVHSSRLVRSE
jgi:hypothetical protein